MTDTSQSHSENLVIQLRATHSGRPSAIDFGSLDLPYTLAASLAQAYSAEAAHLSLPTQRCMWLSCKRFAKYIVSTHPSHSAALPNDILIKYASFLATLPLCGQTKSGELRIVLNVLSCACRIDNRIVKGHLRTDLPLFPRDEVKRSEPLPEQVVKEILRICQLEIEKTEARLELGRRKSSNDPSTKSEDRESDAYQKLTELGGGLLPTLNQLLKPRNEAALRLIRALGGLDTIRCALFLSNRDLLHFYLAILIQTSGNPLSIANIERDCIRSHPLRDDVEWVVWHKPRAKKEQRIDSMRKKMWSAGSLVRRLTKLNSNLVNFAKPWQRSKLFIAYSAAGVSVPCPQTWHSLLNAFIDENNLIDFDFRNFRQSAALAIYRETRDIRAAQMRLNHRSAETTEIYLNGSNLRQENDRVLLKFQGKLLRMIVDESPHRQSLKPPQESTLAGTVFGFQCRGPFEGIAPGTRVGERCMYFTKCATCPGAIVPLDDVATVAQLLKTRDVLRKHREEALQAGRFARFAALYESTLVILEDELLPHVHPAVHEKAILFLSDFDCPILE
ncbi:phage integrase family protein [Paraburkholderia sp. BL8N3]|nr:tyrosine-type recombinase/integrase [Paraburkholderia sp. BL8N3]TCK42386.1 phage integrase family protein [Paraburkholderia sp. BL8N3]